MRKLQQNKTKEQQEMIHEIARNNKKKLHLSKAIQLVAKG